MNSCSNFVLLAVKVLCSHNMFKRNFEQFNIVGVIGVIVVIVVKGIRSCRL
jgi:hypothetical protein